LVEIAKERSDFAYKSQQITSSANIAIVESRVFANNSLKRQRDPDIFFTRALAGAQAGRISENVGHGGTRVAGIGQLSLASTRSLPALAGGTLAVAKAEHSPLPGGI